MNNLAKMHVFINTANKLEFIRFGMDFTSNTHHLLTCYMISFIPLVFGSPDPGTIILELRGVPPSLNIHHSVPEATRIILAAIVQTAATIAFPDKEVQTHSTKDPAVNARAYKLHKENLKFLL